MNVLFMYLHCTLNILKSSLLLSFQNQEKSRTTKIIFWIDVHILPIAQGDMCSH